MYLKYIIRHVQTFRLTDNILYKRSGQYDNLCTLRGCHVVICKKHLIFYMLLWNALQILGKTKELKQRLNNEWR